MTPAERFKRALRDEDTDAVRELLAAHDEARALVNEPFGSFGSRPVTMAARNLPLLDVLLAHGADINAKSAWPPGGFGVLETVTPEHAAPLIARGARVDIVAAAHLGMRDRLLELLNADPSLVHARGGDGKTPLHNAVSLDIARDLVERGAVIDARCIDHHSTPAQYLAREHPEVTRFLVERGAWFDIFIAVALRDAALIDQCLRDDPEALDHRTGHGRYGVPRTSQGVPVAHALAASRGDMYRWVFDHNVTAMDVAAMLGFDEVVAQLARAATPTQRLLAACWRGDRPAAEAIVREQPGIVGTLTPSQRGLISHKAQAGDVAAVALMLDVGFDPQARGTGEAEPLRWGAFTGNVAMVTLLLAHDPPIGVRDPQFQGTPLGWCLHGAVHGWASRRGDFPTCVRLLIEAGERIEPQMYPTGRADVDAVLRERLEPS